MRLRRFTASTLATITIIGASFATANAIPIRKAGADYTTTTEDNLTLNIKRTNEKFDVKLPDNLSILSHQTFLDTKGLATIEGATGKAVDAHIMIGYQLGCMIDVSEGQAIQFGAPKLTTSRELQHAINIMPGIKGEGSADGGGGEISGIGHTTTLTPKHNLEIPLGPDVKFNLKPGQIITFLVAEKDVKGNKGALRYVGEPINVDGCLGFASVRSFVTLWTKAPIEDSKITTWGRVTRF